MDYQLLLGRTLPEAKNLLLGHAVAQEPLVTTTAPPFEPRFRKPVWGEWRVLQASESQAGPLLLVARELLAEQMVPQPDQPSTSRRNRRKTRQQTTNHNPDHNPDHDPDHDPDRAPDHDPDRAPDHDSGKPSVP